MGFDPAEKLSPGFTEALVASVIHRARHLHGGPFARLDPACGGDRRTDRHADFEIPRIVRDLEMMRKPGTRGLDALGGHRGHQLTNARPHHMLDLVLGNGEVNDAGVLGGGLSDGRCLEHRMMAFSWWFLSAGSFTR